jgi:hypothetical protein
MNMHYLNSKPLKSVILFLLLALLSATTLAQEADKKPIDDNLKITISKETTWFTEPLNEDGEIDYWEATNKHFSEGVTPENNLMTAVLMVCGSKIKDEKLRNEMLRRIGLEKLPDFSEQLLEYSKFAKLDILEDETLEMEERVQSLPWTRDAYLDIAKWIDKYSPVVDRYVDQIKHKSTCYYPFVGRKKAGDLVLVAESGDVLLVNKIASFLLTRSLMRLEENDVAGCQSDLIALRKTALLICKNRTAVNLLLGHAWYGRALTCELQMCFHKNTTKEDLLRYQNATKSIRVEYDLPNVIRTHDRIMLLNAAMAIKNGDFALYRYEYLFPGAKMHQLPIRAARKLLDWNKVLTIINERTEKRATIFETKPIHNALHACKAYADSWHEEIGSVNPHVLGIRLLVANGNSKCERMVDAIEYEMAFPDSLEHLINYYCRTKMRESLMDLNLALHCYRHDEGKFPQALWDLQPKYIGELPVDIFTGNALMYKKTEEHFLLYSVGKNFVDDGGDIFSPLGDLGLTSDRDLWNSQFED